MNDRTFKLGAASIMFFVFGAIFTIGGTYDRAGGGPNGPRAGAYEVAFASIALVLSILIAILAAATHIESLIARPNDSVAASASQPTDSPAPTDTPTQ